MLVVFAAGFLVAISSGPSLKQSPALQVAEIDETDDNDETDEREVDENRSEGDDEVESEAEIAYERAAEKEAFPAVPSFHPTDLQGKALDEYQAFTKQLALSGNQFSSAEVLATYIETAAKPSAVSTRSKPSFYAKRRIKGIWDQKNFAMNSVNRPFYAEGGSRVDGATFDPIKKVLYVVSHAGHLYKINPKGKVKWLLRNHKKDLRGDDFNGVNLTNKSFRLLHQNANGPMEFSDDEGRTWANANGAFFENSWNFKTLVTKRGRNRRVVAHGGRYVGPKNIGHHRIYLSNDGGLNYATSQTTAHLTLADFSVQICKPHNSRSVYCFARRKRDSEVFLYRMTEKDNDFIYQGKPTRLAGLENVVGTEVDGAVHFYISFNKTDIYYSKDEGQTWKQISSTNRDQNILEVHPTQPNICFKGFTDLMISTDYGATWTAARHAIGAVARDQQRQHYVWDLQFLRTFDKEKRGNVTVAGFDFGVYVSSKPEDGSSWISVNQGNPIMLSYDAATSEKYDRVYSANQDRGVQSFTDNGSGENHLSACQREASTDILRVATTQGGDSVWFWYYHGAIGVGSGVRGGNYRAVIQKKLFPKFVATSLVPSPNPSEDAVYIPWGKQLQKLSRTGKTIVNQLHEFTFPEEAWSFGYSKLNTDRWYVGLKSGALMFSTDGGKSFKASRYSGVWPRGTSSHRKTRAVIATSPVDEQSVFYAGTGSSFLVSTNGGKTFMNQNNGLQVARIVDLAVSENGKYVFAACGFRGAWVFSVQQKRWYKMDGPDVPARVAFTDVQYISSKDTVRFATYGSGILDFRISQIR